MQEIIHTIKQNCRRCYTCVRDCPAKAIKIEEGQASVVGDRCIACGNCTIVCSRNAKNYISGIPRTLDFLSGSGLTVAMVAPSFPAEYSDVQPWQVVGALRQAGFGKVVEVAYGADVVSRAYQNYLAEPANEGKAWIASACPVVVEFVRKYHPDLVNLLVPIVSPMVATAMAVRKMYGDDARTVFIGPCIAKKLEAVDPLTPPEVDEVLTFQEVHRLLDQKGVVLAKAPAVAFDPPRGGLGRAFPMMGGLLRAANMEHDILDSRVVVTSGHHGTSEVLDCVAKGMIHPALVEALMCRGCYEGPGMTVRGGRLWKKERVSAYVDEAAARYQEMAGSGDLVDLLGGVELGDGELVRQYEPLDQRLAQPSEQEVREVLARTNKFAIEDELNCGTCGYKTCREKAVAVLAGLAEENMCLPFMIEQSERVCHELKIPRRDLNEIHRHIINTEKLASMGQLSAGIAHELNNPLGTIMLYTHLLGRKLKEREDLSHDLKLLVDEAQRCKKIVGGLLDFARQNRVKLVPLDMGVFLRQVLEDNVNSTELSERGISFRLDIPEPAPRVDLDRDQMTQVLVNLINNAVEAMETRRGEVVLSARTLDDEARVRISVSDQGGGIPEEARDKVFQPFFTTKNIGKGTGLGLPISYGIVKMHRGSIWFDSREGEGTVFHIDLPLVAAKDDYPGRSDK